MFFRIVQKQQQQSGHEIDGEKNRLSLKNENGLFWKLRTKFILSRTFQITLLPRPKYNIKLPLIVNKMERYSVIKSLTKKIVLNTATGLP